VEWLRGHAQGGNGIDARGHRSAWVTEVIQDHEHGTEAPRFDAMRTFRRCFASVGKPTGVSHPRVMSRASVSAADGLAVTPSYRSVAASRDRFLGQRFVTVATAAPQTEAVTALSGPTEAGRTRLLWHLPKEGVQQVLGA